MLAVVLVMLKAIWNLIRIFIDNDETVEIPIWGLFLTGIIFFLGVGFYVFAKKCGCP
jgi:hypothetical protein